MVLYELLWLFFCLSPAKAKEGVSPCALRHPDLGRTTAALPFSFFSVDKSQKIEMLSRHDLEWDVTY